jgi:hypothetical protein
MTVPFILGFLLLANRTKKETRLANRIRELAVYIVCYTGHGKFHWLLMVGCGFCLISMVGEIFSTAFINPAAQCEFDMGSSEKGLINAISFIGER